MPSPAEEPPPVGEWPLAGRDDEVERVRSLLVEHGRSVVVAGRTGVGKSRVAQEALDRCRAHGSTVAHVTATRASRGIPLGTFAPLLPVARAERGAVDDRAALLRRCADDLTARAAGSSLVLGVDDAHLLDAMSATLVQQVAASGVVVVATVRSGEPAPDPVTALWKDGAGERIELEGLGTHAIGQVLEAVLGGRPDDAAIAALMARSRGNMLFLRELVTGALADRVLRRDEGIWRLVGELAPTDRLVELVEDRLEGLGAEERELLETVAFGEPLTVDELVRVGSEAVAERLERTGLLRTTAQPSRMVVRLGHPIYGEVLRGRTPGVRARAIARALAETVERTGDPEGEDLLRIASWRLLGGGAEPRLMYEAAVEARWRYDFALAERLARSAVEQGAGLSAAVLAAQLASLQGKTAQADAELEVAARDAGTPEERGRVALVRLDNRVIYAGTIDVGLGIARDAEDELPDSPLRDEIVARRAALLLATEGPREALRVATPLMERASDRALAWACMPGSYSLARMGRIEEALRAARRGHEVQSGLANPVDWYPFMHAFYEAEALTYAGRFAEAADIATAQYRDGVATRSFEQQALFSWQHAKSVGDRGAVDDAIRNLRQAIGIYRQLGRVQFVDFCLVYLAQALALAGRADEARSALEDLDRSGVVPSYFMGVDVPAARAWTEAAGGNLPRAQAWFARAAEEGERIGDIVGALAALHGAARIGEPESVADRAGALAGAVEGELSAARLQHVRALSGGDPRALAEVSQAFERMGALLLAAEAAADGYRCWSRADEKRAAASAARRASDLASRCGGAGTPALRAVEARSHLTPAEWAAAALAASGMSNRAIAAELVVSVRTVENRLQSVYGKLGVRGRTALAAALSTEGGLGPRTAE